MEFLVKSKSGGTKRFFRHAQNSQSLPTANGESYQLPTRSLILEGPYGRIRPLRQFDSVFLIAGSSGATFTVPLMRDIVSCWSKNAHNRRDSCCHPAFAFQGAATRYIRFIWAIKSREQYDWFKPQLETVSDDVRQLKSEGSHFEVDMSIYVTCDGISGADRGRQGEQKPFEVLDGKLEEKTVAQKIRGYVEKENSDAISINSVTSGFQSQVGAITSCGPNGTCCCRRTIEDEGAALDLQEQCCCNCNADKIEIVKQTLMGTQASQKLSSYHQEVRLSTYQEIAMLSGRPQPHSLIRKMLEQALGESAVVVCGPQGLVDGVQRSVVSLSNERAVHKGTGAQGIYFHAESFEY